MNNHKIDRYIDWKSTRFWVYPKGDWYVERGNSWVKGNNFVSIGGDEFHRRTIVLGFGGEKHRHLVIALWRFRIKDCICSDADYLEGWLQDAVD